MSTSSKRGDISEKLVVKWRLKDFLQSLKEDDLFYTSPLFSFAGHSWYVKMYPYGRKCDKTTEYIALYLMRKSFGSAVKIKYSLEFKTVDGEMESELSSTKIFCGADNGIGSKYFLKMANLLKRKSDLLFDDDLTLMCTLEKEESIDTEKNEKLLSDMKRLMLSGEHSDTVIKVKDEEFKLHRNILGSRNCFFHAMFECDMKEKATGIVTIENCEPEIFLSFIYFVYTGKLDTLLSENVCELYYAADKYQEDQLKNECLQFMKGAFSVDSFIDFKILALKNDEKELLQKATDFFCKAAKEIIRGVKWQNFIKEYPTQANELFIKTLDQYPDKDDDGSDEDDFNKI